MKSEQKNLNVAVKNINPTAGITLIALIVTIIVLLILTGVSIATLSGDNGILNKAATVKTQMTIAEEKEAISLAYSAAMIERRGGTVIASDIEAELLTNGYDSTKVIVTADGENTKVVFTTSGNSYIVTPKGVITDVASEDMPEDTTDGKVYANPDEWDYTIDASTNTATLTNYKVKGATKVVIPNYVKTADGDIPVKEIAYENDVIASSIWQDITGEKRYDYNINNTIQEIVVSEGIEIIGPGAFSGTSKLTKITLPNTIKKIEYDAFYNCASLTSIAIPNGVSSIGAGVFGQCTSLVKINIDKTENSISGSPWGADNATVNWTGTTSGSETESGS